MNSIATTAGSGGLLLRAAILESSRNKETSLRHAASVRFQKDKEGSSTGRSPWNSSSAARLCLR